MSKILKLKLKLLQEGVILKHQKYIDNHFDLALKKTLSDSKIVKRTNLQNKILLDKIFKKAKFLDNFEEFFKFFLDDLIIKTGYSLKYISKHPEFVYDYFINQVELIGKDDPYVENVILGYLIDDEGIKHFILTLIKNLSE